MFRVFAELSSAILINLKARHLPVCGTYCSGVAAGIKVENLNRALQFGCLWQSVPKTRPVGNEPRTRLNISDAPRRPRMRAALMFNVHFLNNPSPCACKHGGKARHLA